MLKQIVTYWGMVLLAACVWVSAATAQEQALAVEPDVPIDVSMQVRTLLVELSQANYRQKAKLIEQLDQTAGREILPVYESLLEGNLYFDDDSDMLYRSYKNSQGQELAEAILQGSSSATVELKSLKKVRVNNRLRKQLRNSIARIQLLHGEPGERRQAAETMLDDLSAETVALLQTAQQQESVASIRELLEAGLAVHTLQSSPDSNARVAAVQSLSGRLEAPVRNSLASLLEKQDGEFVETDAAVRAAAAKALQDIDGSIRFYGFMETLFFGLSLGSVLLLAAIGLAITFGVMGVINMAHGEMIMLGAYTTYVVQLLMPNSMEWSILIAIPAAFLVSGSVGVLIERSVIRFLHGRPLETLLATFGISLVLQQLVRTVFSPLNRQVSTPEWLSGSIAINPVFSLTYNRLSILLFSLMVFVALILIMKKTSLGLNVRAVSQNRNMAKSMGINTDRVDSMTFGLGSGIAGVAGVALSQLTNVGPNLGQSYIIDSFMVVVFGGVGNLLGTLVGAFSLGVANKFLEPVTGAVLANIVILLFIILFIQKRPKGLFPQKGRAAE